MGPGEGVRPPSFSRCLCQLPLSATLCGAQGVLAWLVKQALAFRTVNALGTNGSCPAAAAAHERGARSSSGRSRKAAQRDFGLSHVILYKFLSRQKVRHAHRRDLTTIQFLTDFFLILF